ncbi:hypothetical protein ACHAWU_001991 [Discostella pseudostelligera]|uniref:Rab-GAP TBC domain-containing protein n=1 Tax=Discostella pseudostelligera TaxID=259834 RepID=A0ABD3MKN6_9STRA
MEGVAIGQQLMMTLGTVEHVVSTCTATARNVGAGVGGSSVSFKDDPTSLYRFSEHQILHELSTLLQSNLHCKTHYSHHHFKKYKHCFTGLEMIDYLMEHKLVSSRDEGVSIGHDLIMTLGTVECVSATSLTMRGEHHSRQQQQQEFKDDASSFYRFRDRSISGESKSPPSSPCEGAAAPAALPNGGIRDDRGIEIKMDKYGFLLDDDEAASAKATTTNATADENLTELICPSDAKWEKLLDKTYKNANSSSLSLSGLKRATATTSTANLSKVKNYARRGLPDSVRPKAWTTLTGVDVMMNKFPGRYEELVQKADEEYRKHHEDQECASVSLGTMCCDAMNGGSFAAASAPEAAAATAEQGQTSDSNRVVLVLDTIERDIHRTFPKHYLFHSGFDEANDDVGNGNGIIEVDSDNIGSDDDDAESDVIKERYSTTTMNDDIEIDDSTGIDPTFDVEAKKKMFNESMNTLMTNIGCGVLDNIASHTNDNPGAGSKEAHTTDCQEGSANDDAIAAKTNGAQPSSLVEGMGMGQGQNSLRRVLRAYSLYDTEVGYCQGMNYIAAMFLTFLSEEKAFWLLVVVMNDEPYRLRDLFGEDMSGAHEVLYIAEKLLAQFLPKLAKHLEAESIHVSMFVTPWLLTAYTSTFPFDLVARVWDCFLVEGWKVLYRVMLSLLEFASKDIFDLQFEQILSYFRDFPTKINGRVILTSSLKIGLKKKHIQKHAKEWRRHAGGAGMK